MSSCKWQDKVLDILEQNGASSVHTMLRVSQLRWAGHTTRMSDDRLPKPIRYRELQTYWSILSWQPKETLQGHPEKVPRKDFDIDPASCETFAQDRSAQLFALSEGANAYVQHRIEAAKNKRVVLPSLSCVNTWKPLMLKR